MGKVEIVEDDDNDDDDESGDQVLQEQFNRFAMAMALQDNAVGEQVMEEMRYVMFIICFHFLLFRFHNLLPSLAHG